MEHVGIGSRYSGSQVIGVMNSELKGACDELCGFDARNEHVYIFSLPFLPSCALLIRHFLRSLIFAF